MEEQMTMKKQCLAMLPDRTRLAEVLREGSLTIGGDQEWFADQGLKDGGCGIIAAANLMAYQNPKLPEHFGSYEDYLNQVSVYIRPWRLPGGKTLGIWPVSRLETGMRRFLTAQTDAGAFCAWQTRCVVFDCISSMASEARLRDWLIRHICAGEPAAMLIGNNHRFDLTKVKRPDGFAWIQKNFARHWVTVIGVWEDQGETELEVVTWGGIAYLKLSDWKHMWPQAFLCLKNS